MSKISIESEMAKIAISKNLVKEYSNSEGRVVYLNNGTEFQMYIKNPETDCIGVRISLNGKDLGNLLVLKPGQSVWLERYLNDNKKFLFSTYEVENSAEMINAISKNGKVEFSFFREKPTPTYSPEISLISGSLWNNTTYHNSTRLCSSSLCSDLSTSTSYKTFINYSNSANCARGTVSDATFSLAKESSLETGRVEKGSESNQKFTNIDVDFYSYPFKKEEILILPSSRKAVTPNDTKRKYCSNCGKKVKPTDKFCSSCGSKLY